MAVYLYSDAVKYPFEMSLTIPTKWKMTVIGRNFELADFKVPLSIADVQFCMASTKPRSLPDPLRP